MLLGIVEEKDFIVRMSESIAKRHLKGPERKGRRAREEERGGVRGSRELMGTRTAGSQSV